MKLVATNNDSVGSCECGLHVYSCTLQVTRRYFCTDTIIYESDVADERMMLLLHR
jgi:hypothetical protein